MKTETNQKPKKMSKEQQRKQAFELLEQGYTQKETAQILGVTAKTITLWRNKYKSTKSLLNETAFLLLEIIYKKLKNRELDEWEISEFTKNVFMLSNVLGKNAKDGYIKSINQKLISENPIKAPETRQIDKK